jgi:Beta-propeller repeat
VIKYADDGTFLWIRHIATPQRDVALSCATSPQGDVYVPVYSTGNLHGFQNIGSEDGFLLKYSGTGLLEWTKQEASTSHDYALSVDVDASGRIFMLSASYGKVDGGSDHIGYWDIRLSCYHVNGTRVFARHIGSTTNEEAVRSGFTLTTSSTSLDSRYAHGSAHLAVSAYGDSYFTFHSTVTPTTFSGSAKGNNDVYITKYDVTGTHVWTGQVGAPGEQYSSAICIDANEDVYAMGRTQSAIDGQVFAGHTDVFLSKFNRNGVKQWTRLLGHTGYQYGTTVAADNQGGVYVGGISNSETFDGETRQWNLDNVWEPNYEYGFLSKFDAFGNRIFTRFMSSYAYAGASYHLDPNLLINSIVVLPNNQLQIAGSYVGVFSTPADLAADPAEAANVKGFVFTAVQNATCSLGEFDELMTDIAAILDTME